MGGGLQTLISNFIRVDCNMNNIWLTSDTHFHHSRILEFCPKTRQGKDAEEMTELMIQAWNSVVKKGDTVYHCGDFCFRGKTQVIDCISRLNGQVHIILGNHDHIIKKNKEICSMFASVQQMKHVKVGDDRFILSHFPQAEWWDSHKGTIHCFGHVHGGTQNIQHQLQFKCMDVGIDARGDDLMLPFHIDEILEKMKDREIMSHH